MRAAATSNTSVAQFPHSTFSNLRDTVQDSSTQQGFIGAQVQRNFMLQCLHSITGWAECLAVVFAKQPNSLCVRVCVSRGSCVSIAVCKTDRNEAMAAVHARGSPQRVVIEAVAKVEASQRHHARIAKGHPRL